MHHLKAVTISPYATHQEITNRIGKTSKTVQRTFAILKDRGLEMLK